MHQVLDLKKQKKHHVLGSTAAGHCIVSTLYKVIEYLQKSVTTNFSYKRTEHLKHKYYVEVKTLQQ